MFTLLITGCAVSLAPPWHSGAEYCVHAPRPAVRRFLQREEGEHQLGKSFLQEPRVRSGESLGALLQKRPLSVKVDGEKKPSPEHFFLFCKCPVIYGSVLPLTDWSAVVTDALQRVFLRVSSCPHVGAIVSAHVHGNETAGRQMCGSAAWLAPWAASHVPSHQRVRIPFYPQPRQRLPPNSLVLAKLTSVQGHFLTLWFPWSHSSSASSASLFCSCLFMLLGHMWILSCLF